MVNIKGCQLWEDLRYWPIAKQIYHNSEGSFPG